MSASKAAGTRFESQAVEFLRGHGFPHAERRAQGGIHDKGDIAGVVGWTLECKATKSIDLAGAVDEARVEAKNAGGGAYAAIVKRRQKGTGEAYVVMPLSVFCQIAGD